MAVHGSSQKNAGFSLIEVVIAMTVLAVGLLGFISLYGTGFKALQVSSIRTTALRLAQDKMETLRRSRPTSTSPPDPADTPEEGITRSWSVKPHAVNSNIWVISVQVTWTDQEGQSKKVVLKSYRSI